MRRVTQEEWDRRAAKLNIEWLEPVHTDRRPVEAKCLKCGYRWKKRPDKVQQGRGCPNCAGLIVTQQDWDKRAAKVGVEWLEEVTSAGTKTESRCLVCGWQEKRKPADISQGRGCPRCAGKRTTQEEWDQRARDRGFEWLEPVKRSHDNTPARCLTCGYEWMAGPSYRTGCPSCKKVASPTQEEWDRRASAAGIEWLEPVDKAMSSFRARCLSCGHEYKARAGNVTSGRGCRKCANKASGIKRRATKDEMNQLADSRGIVWLSDDLSMSKQVPARCLTCGFEWQAWPQSVKAGNGCPRCSGKATSPQDWEDRAARQGIEWLEPVKTNHTKTLARCLNCSYEWMANPATIAAGSSCPNCAEYGFKPDKPTTLYLLIRDDGVAKVGVTNKGGAEKARMRRLAKLGYEIKMTWNFDLGSDALAVERSIVKQWREDDQLLPAAADDEEGRTETVHTDSLSLYEISRRINDLIRAT